jgi:hypothetical protein
LASARAKLTPLLIDLDSNDIETRDRATLEIVKIGVAAIPELDRVAPTLFSEESRGRVRWIMHRIDIASDSPDVGATAMALLAFFAAGHYPTHLGDMQCVTQAGVTWLISQQKLDGSFEGPPLDSLLAALVLVEAHGASGQRHDEPIKKAACAAFVHVRGIEHLDEDAALRKMLVLRAAARVGEGDFDVDPRDYLALIPRLAGTSPPSAAAQVLMMWGAKKKVETEALRKAAIGDYFERVSLETFSIKETLPFELALWPSIRVPGQRDTLRNRLKDALSQGQGCEKGSWKPAEPKVPTFRLRLERTATLAYAFACVVLAE